ALEPYASFFAGSGMHQIVWSRDFFTLVDDPTRRPTEPVNVAGGARCLIYGPYIHLAAGSWSARVVLGFSGEAVGHIFMVDACSGGQQLAASSFQPQTAGVYTAEISFWLAHALD